MKLTRDTIRMVLIDDAVNDRELLQFALTQAGFTHPLTPFESAGIALDYFTNAKAVGAELPHLVLLDLNMPVVDGVRALALVREAAECRELPVIILTGSDDVNKRRELAHLGIFSFLKKQHDNANVVAALDDFIGLYNDVVLAPSK